MQGRPDIETSATAQNDKPFKLAPHLTVEKTNRT